MIDMVNFEGAKAKVRQFSFRFSAIAVLAIATLVWTGCGSSEATVPTDDNNPQGTAATVNGKAIKMEDVERVIKAQMQGQQGRLSPLELAQARLQVLDTLIQQEVMYQKAETEKTVPTDDKVTEELNKLKQQGGSAEDFDKKMKEAGETEATLRESIKKNLAIQALNDKVTSKIEPPKDQEIVEFFNGNREQFKNKRGAQLGVIVIDPRKVDQNDTTTNEIEAQQKAKEVGERLLRGADFATVAREASEDPQTKLQGGDWRYFSEDEIKQTFGAGLADYVMTKMQNGQIVPQAIPFENRILIIKLQRKQEQDEDRTLETPGVRQQITDLLINSRKQILSQAYMALAMDGAKVDNLLAKRVVENPNTLSGARPAGSDTPAANTNAMTPAANTNAANTTNANTNTRPGNANTNTNANAARPATSPAANTNASPRR